METIGTVKSPGLIIEWSLDSDESLHKLTRMSMSSKVNDASPFAQTASARPTVSLWMLLFSLVVCAAFSLLLMFAAHVPLISNAVNDFFGLPQTAKSGKPDRAAHLYFLLFCYASPLLLVLTVGLLHMFSNKFIVPLLAKEDSSEPDSPFA